MEDLGPETKGGAETEPKPEMKRPGRETGRTKPRGGPERPEGETKRTNQKPGPPNRTNQESQGRPTGPGPDGKPHGQDRDRPDGTRGGPTPPGGTTANPPRFTRVPPDINTSLYTGLRYPVQPTTRAPRVEVDLVGSTSLGPAGHPGRGRPRGADFTWGLVGCVCPAPRV